jgi:hypothetical protein
MIIFVLISVQLASSIVRVVIEPGSDGFEIAVVMTGT